MSLFSRFFRKAPPSVTPQTSQRIEPRTDPGPAKNGPPQNGAAQAAPDRALIAARQVATEEEALRIAIECNDADAIARLVVEGASTKIRQLAAQAIEDPARLRELIRQVRGGNDKSVYKILTAKRDAQLGQARKLEQLQAEISSVAAAIERHSQRAYDPLFSPTLDQLEIRWKAVATDAGPEVVRQVQDAIDRAREVIAQHLRQVAAVASRELAASNAAAEAQRLREQEEKAAAAAATERAKVEEERRRELAQQQEAEALSRRQLGGLIRKALAALNEGSSGRAAGLRRAIEEKMSGAPPLPGYLTSQLQQLDSRLNELKDWKSFSVGPKRVGLMEEMESLVGSTLDPPALADRIKSLQEEWRTLSRGAGENLESDWQRFQEAAQKAYQPCREYFEEQSALRQENLRRREALLARLVAFETGHNWEQPDWRTVSLALRESRQEWRRHSPVDRAAGKAPQEQFVAVTSKLQSRLDAEYAANIEAKRGLIERARELRTGEDSRKSIDDVKELQRKWKAVGLVPREEDHRLWEEFRQHCDDVYQRRQQEFAEYTAGLEANKSKAVQLCEELETLAAAPAEDLLAGAAELADRQAAFEAIGEFPRSGARELRNRFERALQRCEEAVDRQKARDVERSWNDLFDAANNVRAYRLAAMRNTDSVERDSLRRAAEDYIGSVQRWPRGGLETLKQALGQALNNNGNGGDLAANEMALRMLCIRAEILTDRATPPEDQPLRRQYQVERLVQSMGQGITADDNQLDLLAIEWLRVGPTEEGTYLPLLERFKRCRPGA